MSSPIEPDQAPSEAQSAAATPSPELTGPYYADVTTSAESPAASAGRCRLLGEIARGGMGAVFKAHDPELGRDLAVKVLLERHRGRPDLVRRFLEEARVGGRLQHPGVAPVHDVGRLADERPYFAMKLVEGRTLDELLRRRKNPAEDLPRYLKVFEQLCQTLAFAHTRGIIHRDLKPLNVMVGAFGEVQVMDWGLAKIVGAPDGIMAPGEDGPHAEVTASGQVLGTPSYMAPEQARGEAERLDARCDVFGLGAILCTILTGAPPYVGGDAREVLTRASRGELSDAYARLDACGAEAELVDLAKRWLSADPADRPADAGLVAEAMTGHLAGVQDRLRQAELAKTAAQTRAEEERKRRRLTVVLATTVVLALTGAGVGALWYQHDQSIRAAEHARRAADTERDVTAALDEATTLGKQAEAAKANPTKWEAALTEALSAVKRAEGVLNGGADDTGKLKERVASLRKDLEAADRDRWMVAALEEARFREAAAGNEEGFDMAGAAALYATAFRQDDKEWDSLAAKDAAARINRRAVREEMLAALDDWAKHTPNKAEAQRARDILGAADPDPSAFRNRWQSLIAKQDWDGLRKMAAGTEAQNAPAAILALRGWQLAEAGGAAEAERLLKRANDRSPGDFWIAFGLARASSMTKPPATDEAIRYYTAALMLRPDSAAAHSNLGDVLCNKGLWEEAITEFHKAIVLKPDSAELHTNLGTALRGKRLLAEAIEEHRKAIALNPDFAYAHNNLGVALRDADRLNEAIDEFRKAIDRRPDYAQAHTNLGAALYDMDRTDEAITEHRKAIEAKPDYAGAHTNLGAALDRKGRVDEAIEEYGKAIELNPDDVEAHTDLGAALDRKGRVDEAIEEYHRAIALRPSGAAAHSNLGAALHQVGRLEEAVEEYRKASELDPEDPVALYNLGMGLRRVGRFSDSVAAVRRCHDVGSKKSGWRYPSADWVREAEELVRLDALFPALLQGTAEPASPAVGLRLGQVCVCKRLNAAGARFYAGAFAFEPAFAANPASGARFDAACAAALAGCGRGEDAGTTDAKERAHWRAQAHNWLRADLPMWTRVIDDGGPEGRATAARTLRRWKQYRDLAGVRDADGLAGLPPEEQAVWRKLWADVDARLERAQAR